MISGCPQSATYTVPLGTSGSIATWIEPTAIDDSRLIPTSVQSHQSGDTFMVGVTQVTYVFSDSSGNQAICSFSINGNFFHGSLQCKLVMGNVSVLIEHTTTAYLY